MSKNISNYTRKQNIKNILDKIIIKIFDMILYPLRYIYKHKYDGSELQSKRKVKKAYKKLKNDIYKELLCEDHIYITDSFVGSDNDGLNIVSISEYYTLLHFSKKTSKVIFNEIEEILRADESLVVESVKVKDVFKYGCYKEDSRVIKVMIIDKEEK